MDLSSIKPRSIVYLFSGGKDSSSSLILTRDAVKEYADKTGTEVYIAYIYVTGNTHPLNAYCASTVMLWHEKNYGFKPIWLANNKLFQEGIRKYGLEIGERRWCYLMFKLDVLEKFEKTLPRPVVEIDGMKPSDSKQRNKLVKDEFQEIVRSNGFKFYAWHPLFSTDNDNVFDMVRKHEEFKCVAELYEKFGDSLNCIVCPYKKRDKIAKYHYADGEALQIIHQFMKEAVRSKKWLKLYEPPVNILKYVE